MKKVKKKTEEMAIPSDPEEVKKMFGYLIPYKVIEVPIEHRWRKNVPHSLKCFRKVYQRDEEGQVLKHLPKRRCRRQVEEGYLFCSKHGGRKKSFPMQETNPHNTSVAKAYKNIYDAQLSDLMDSFLNDPNLLDLKPDLANLRVVLNNYITKLVSKPHSGTVLNFTTRVRDILTEEEKSEEWKYNKIIEIVESQNSLTSGKCIDRINRCVENIGRQIERIRKFETQGNFLLTPDGMKIILRAIVDILNTNIEDKGTIDKIREQLLTLSIETQGELNKYGESKRAVSYDAEAEIVEDS